MNSLTRSDILDIFPAVIQAMPNSNVTASSATGIATLQSQPFNSANAANPREAVSSNSDDAANPIRQALLLDIELLIIPKTT